MENEGNLVNLMSITMQKIRDMVDVNTVIGDPVVTANGTVIPVSKVSFGFTSGGVDMAQKKEPAANGGISFGGGAGAGVSITPIAFLFVSESDVKLLPVTQPSNNSIDRVVDSLPGLVDKVSALFKKNEETASSPDEE